MRAILALTALAATAAWSAPAAAQYYPQINELPRGDVSVRVSRDCRVVYDRNYRQKVASRACDRRDRRFAYNEMRRWREGNDRYGDNRYRYDDRYDDYDRDRYDDDRYDDDRYDDDRYDDDRRYGTRDYDREYRGRYVTVIPARQVGERTDRAYDAMYRGGFTMTRSWREDRDEEIAIWWNARERRCVSMRSEDGKVRSVFPMPDNQCYRR